MWSTPNTPYRVEELVVDNAGSAIALHRQFRDTWWWSGASFPVRLDFQLLWSLWFSWFTPPKLTKFLWANIKRDDDRATDPPRDAESGRVEVAPTNSIRDFWSLHFKPYSNCIRVLLASTGQRLIWPKRWPHSQTNSTRNTFAVCNRKPERLHWIWGLTGCNFQIRCQREPTDSIPEFWISLQKPNFPFLLECCSLRRDRDWNGQNGHHTHRRIQLETPPLSVTENLRDCTKPEVWQLVGLQCETNSTIRDLKHALQNLQQSY